MLLLLVLVQPFQGFNKVGASDIIYVPGDFATIQEAIDNATSGDTIMVSNGRYKENIVVDKSLTIQGAHKSTALIDGMQNGDTVSIYADDVYFTGFTVYNSSDDGLYITGDNVTVESCNIRKNYQGMYLSGSNYSNVVDCSIYNCSWAGIEVSTSHFLTVSSCDFYDLYEGFFVYQSHDCLVNGSEFHHGYRGFYARNTINLFIIDSDIYNQTGYEALYLEDSDGLTIDNCRIYNNTVSRALELETCDGFIISASEVHDNNDKAIDIGSCKDGTVNDCIIYNNKDNGIQCSNSEMVTIRNCHTFNNSNYAGIYLGACNLCWLIGTESTGNTDGLRMYSSDRTSICNSSFTDNSDDGIDLDSCLKTYITDSRIINNHDGIEHDHSQSVITCSNFSDNYVGIDIYNSLLNIRYCSFEDNTNYGVYGSSDSDTNAALCRWGNETGPSHWSNPSGTGDRVSDYVDYDPWQTELYQPEVLISKLRCEFRYLDWRVTYPDQVTPKPLGCGAAMTSDWLASAYVTTKLSNIAEGLDTNSDFVNQATGEPLGDPGTGILTFGGPFVNPVVKRAEDMGTPEADRAPVRFHDGGDTFYFQYMNGTNIPGASLPLSVINNDEDLFVIERYIDGDGRLITICYGFGWPGTYAAGKYFDREMFPNLGRYNQGWVIAHWHDTNMDGFVNNPGEGDTYTVIAAGN
jgi:parallel beta-helix repeat protein